MHTTFPTRPIPLRQPFVWRHFDAVLDGLQGLRRRVRGWYEHRAELRRNAQAERQLARMSVRTLQDIGAPETLIGQRRRQDEHEAMRQSYWLNPRC